MEYNEYQLTLRTRRANMLLRRVVVASFVLLSCVQIGLVVHNATRAAVNTLTWHLITLSMSVGICVFVWRSHHNLLYAVTNQHFETMFGERKARAEVKELSGNPLSVMEVRFYDLQEMKVPFERNDDIERFVPFLFEAVPKAAIESGQVDPNKIKGFREISALPKLQCASIDVVLRTKFQQKVYGALVVLVWLLLIGFTIFVAKHKAASRDDAQLAALIFIPVWTLLAFMFWRFQQGYVHQIANEGIELCSGKTYEWSAVKRMKYSGVSPQVEMSDGRRVRLGFDCPEALCTALDLLHERLRQCC